MPLWSALLATRCAALGGYEGVSLPSDATARHAFLSFSSTADAGASVAALSPAGVKAQYAIPRRDHAHDEVVAAAGPLSVPCAAGAERAVPGMHLLPDIVSEAEERDLLALLEALPWQALRHRRVQHYGHAFLYDRLNVDLGRVTAPPLPAALEPLRTRLEAAYAELVGPGAQLTLDQLTVNDYPCGV